MSSIAERIKIAQDKDGMLRRALERIIQLYTDRSHFVYELLQNAEDAEATSIKFVQYPNRLEVMHNGKPFTAENLQGLCDIGKSDKVDDLNQIGEFGVGFKSVFGICDTVKLFSVPEHFRRKDIGNAIPFAVEIQDFTSPVDIPQEQLGQVYTTKFVFPYSVGRTFSGFKTIEELNRTLSLKLQNLGITTLLFMKNLELIEYQIQLGGKPIEGQYLLEKQTINGHCSLVSALGLSDAVGTAQEEISYLKFSRNIDKESNRTVDIAFPVTVDENGGYECQKQTNPYISVYFPTETESKLGFIVQGPYRTTPNRSSIPADDLDNIRLAKETATLLSDTIRELRYAGKFNMSFVKALPLSASSFDNYALFAPLYETVKALFAREDIIPCKNGEYVAASCAKIARQERLTTAFSDELLSSLIHDGKSYRWLPTYLTETNREYEAVYKYLTSELKISVVRPEDLRPYFAKNPAFLRAQSEDWLVELYSILENVAASFSKTKNEANLLTAEIIKTSTGEFVAAYRKTENKQYIPNVFLPANRISSSDIHFVDSRIYERCRYFFDEILQLQKPNEYEFFVRDIKKRYSGGYSVSEENHIEDLLGLCRYLKYEEYKAEVRSIINDHFVLRCKDGGMRNAFMLRIFLPISKTGVRIEEYLKNIAPNAFFVDLDFYLRRGVSVENLCALGVRDSLLCNENVTTGQYSTGKVGKQPEWWTAGPFRWELTIDYLKEALKYISEHPAAKDSVQKSQTILKILLENEEKLCGLLHIGGSTPNKENEPCKMVRVLRGESILNWDGKWLYTDSLELVSQKQVSKHDIHTDIYGKVKSDSTVYDLLGFRKTEADEVDALKKTIPQNQLDAYFENELKQRFGITSADLSETFGKVGRNIYTSVEEEYDYTFPTAKVKNWVALKTHAAEMLSFAAPVEFAERVRRVRVSNKPAEARAYVTNMYRYAGAYKYACQMCHTPHINIDKAQLFNNPEFELSPMHLCLCPNCRSEYQFLRNDEGEMKRFKERILNLKEDDSSCEECAAVELGNHEIWFTQTHIAEIKALIQLEQEIKAAEVSTTAPQKSTKVVSHMPIHESPSAKGEWAALYVSAAYVGARIRRKKDGFLGEITQIEREWLYAKILNGQKAGETAKIKLTFIKDNPGVYEILKM